MKKYFGVSGLTALVLARAAAGAVVVLTYPFETPKQTSKRYTCLALIFDSTLLQRNAHGNLLNPAPTWSPRGLQQLAYLEGHAHWKKDNK